MRKKNFKGAKVSKRVVAKCEGVCRTYDAIQYAYANLLSETEEVKSFQVKGHTHLILLSQKPMETLW